jgi:hypothetical protein
MSEDETSLETLEERVSRAVLSFSRWQREHRNYFDADSGAWLVCAASSSCDEAASEGKRLCMEATSLERETARTAVRFIELLEGAKGLVRNGNQWFALFACWRRLKHACRYRDQLEAPLATPLKQFVGAVMRQIDECPLVIAALGAAEPLPAGLTGVSALYQLHPHRLWIRVAHLVKRIQATMSESAERLEPGVGALRRTRRRWVYAETLHQRALEALRQLFSLLQDRAETIAHFYRPTYSSGIEIGDEETFSQWLTNEEKLRDEATRAAAFLWALSGDDALYAFMNRQDDAASGAFTLRWLHHVE